MFYLKKQTEKLKSFGSIIVSLGDLFKKGK